MASLDPGPPSSPIEYARQISAPAVALAAGGLALVCTTSLAGVLHRLLTLHLLSTRFVGSLGLGLSLCVVSVAAALLLSRHIGAGPFLAAGAVLAAIGIRIGAAVSDAGELVIGAVVLGAASGCLIGGAASMPFELPWRSARLAAVGWAAPLAAGWPIQAWLARDDRRTTASLVVPHAAGLAYLAVAVVLAWSITALLVRPTRARSVSVGWREPWAALASAVAMLCVLSIVVGFDARLRLFWLRPVVLVAAALALAIWILVMMLVPSPAAKISYLAVSLVAAALPPTLQLLVVADSLSSGLSGLVARCLAVGAAGAIGVVVGWRHPRSSVVYGLLAMAAGAVFGWPGYGAAWISTLLIAWLSAAGVAVVTGSLALALESEAALRFVSFGFAAGLVAGLLMGIPLVWALLGDLPLTAESSRAGVRVVLGLTFAASVLVAAQAAVLGHRIDRRVAKALVPSPGHR